MVRQLDNNEYADADLIELKVAMHLPYNADWKEYERYTGQIEIEGVHYNYVKRKISSDTMYLLCIPNHDKTLLYDTKYDIAEEINDRSPGSKKNSEPASKKISQVNEYDFSLSPLSIESFIAKEPAFNSFEVPHLCSSFIPGAAQPPEMIV